MATPTTDSPPYDPGLFRSRSVAPSSTRPLTPSGPPTVGPSLRTSETGFGGGSVADISPDAWSPPLPPAAPGRTVPWSSEPSRGPDSSPPSGGAPAQDRGSGHPGPRWPVLVATIALSVAGGAVAGRLTAGRSTVETSTVTDSAVVAVTSATTTAGLDVGAVLDAVNQSVVSIDTVVETRRGPFVEQSAGAGTGVVWTSDGLILTNAHVVADAGEVTVTLDGETTARSATVVALDEASDIAVVSVDDTTGLVPAELASSETVAVGDPVVAIGNALALDGSMTVTSGIVSATDRSISTDTGELSGLIQTDAAISSGNSGGPLVDAAGRVIGINSAVAASYGGVQASNIGFAISIDRAIEVAEGLLAS